MIEQVAAAIIKAGENSPNGLAASVIKVAGAVGVTAASSKTMIDNAVAQEPWKIA